METRLSNIPRNRQNLEQTKNQGNGISLTVHVLSGILASYPPDWGVYQILGDSLLKNNQPDLARIVYHLGLGSNPESQDLKIRLNQTQTGSITSPQVVSK